RFRPADDDRHRAVCDAGAWALALPGASRPPARDGRRRLLDRAALADFRALPQLTAPGGAAGKPVRIFVAHAAHLPRRPAHPTKSRISWGPRGLRSSLRVCRIRSLRCSPPHETHGFRGDPESAAPWIWTT